MASRMEWLELLKFYQLQVLSECVSIELESNSFLDGRNPFFDHLIDDDVYEGESPYEYDYQDPTEWGIRIEFRMSDTSFAYYPYIYDRDSYGPTLDDEYIELSEEEIDVLKSKMNAYAEPIIKMLKGDF